ncbi:MAG TPA: gas vesicle protein GvpG [Thermoanaerobaculia bacterium]
MIILDSLLMGGIRFVLDKVAAAVDNEMNDEGSLREDLLAAQMQLELGEIDDEEFAEIERAVLARMREIRESREEGALGLPSDARVIGVDVTFEAPDEPEDR